MTIPAIAFSELVTDTWLSDVATATNANTASINDAWTAVPFSAGNFTAAGSMTWTVGSGDVITNKYKVLGKTLIWQVQLENTTVGGTPSNQLKIAVPVGTIKGVANAAAWMYDNSVAFMGYVNNGSLLGSGSSSVVGIVKSDQSNYSAATNTTIVTFTLVAELN
jgi:hypothetical protein